MHTYKMLNNKNYKKIFRHSYNPSRQRIKQQKKNVNNQISTSIFYCLTRIYEKKLVEFKIQKKILQSTFINQMKMKIAKTKYLLCEQIFHSVLLKLETISSSQDTDYQLILIKYIVEGCIQMFEENIKVHVLSKDVRLVNILKFDILKTFKFFLEEQIGQQFEFNLIIAQNDCLKTRSLSQQLNKNQESTHTIGGVILSNLEGNILFKNTFDTRLNILKEIILPLIRQMLWQSENLKINSQEQELKQT